MKRRTLPCVLAGVLALPAYAIAQRPVVPVRGIVFDSLRGQPLRNAFVMMAGGHTINTDDRGRFQFDSVEPGAYTFTVHHAVLDSIGFSGLSTHATITNGDSEVRLAVPSFATLWRAACGRSRVPADSGIVYGTVRDVRTGDAVGDAAVALTWTDLVLDPKTHRIVERRYQIDTRTNANGGYAICGVAPDLSLRLHASADSAASGVITLNPERIRVERRDLAVGPERADSASRGTISGVVTGSDGEPVMGAHVRTDTLRDAVTDGEGRFALTGIPSGSVQLDIVSIGVEPTSRVVDVMPAETTHVALTVGTVVMLDGVRTTAAAAMGRVFATEFTMRRKSGFGYSMDSTTIGTYSEFVNVLQAVPSLNLRVRSSSLGITMPDPRGKSCAPDVLIDGTPATNGHLFGLFPSEVAGIEVYSSPAHVPSRFARIGIQPQCGMILVWTKYGFRNR